MQSPPPNAAEIPPPPQKPDAMECCGSGCVPCIFDYYEIKLQEWEQKYNCTLGDYQSGDYSSTKTK